MSKRAVLLVNLGSPDTTSVPDVRRYLEEFLGDPRVIDRPRNIFLRSLLVNKVIISKRVKNSAHAYESIWTKEGSPLIVTSRSVRDKLAATLGAATPVYMAMRYRNPSIASVIAQMAADGVRHVLLFPQYPQYAMSSWETVVVEVYEQAAKLAPGLRIDCVQPFYNDADYVSALVASAQPYLEQPHDHVLFSFHGIPERHLREADSSHAHCTMVADCCLVDSPIHSTCYKAQCLKLVRAFTRNAGLSADRYSVAFQSRLVGEPWLSPFTDIELARLPSAGVKRLFVLSPAFVTDCLETLEELSVAGKKTFLDAGGEFFQQIPCLNDQPMYLEFLEKRVKRWLSGESTVETQSIERAALFRVCSPAA